MSLAGSITAKVVALAIIVLVICAAVLPAISDSQKSLITEEQNASERYILSSSANDVTFTYSGGKPYVNGESLDDLTTGLTDPTRFYVISDVAMMFITWTPSTSSWSSSIAILGPVLEPDRIALTLSGSSDYVKFEDGTVSIYRAGSPVIEVTGQYSYLLVPSATGDYGAYTTADLTDVHVDFDKTIYIIGGNNLQNGFVATGTIDDLSFSFNYYSQTAVVGGTITANYTEDEYGLTASLTGATVSTGTASAGYYFVPLTYSAIKDNDGSLYTLIGVLPILLIFVPVMFAVRMLGAGRN